MRISKTEVRLRRLLAAVPQQTNKRKLVHHVATLQKLLNTLKEETTESSSSLFSDAKPEFYAGCIEELACKLDMTKTEDIWESLGSGKGLEVRGQVSASDGVQELTSDLPLFPSCLKRKYSPEADFLSGLECEESGIEDLNVEDDILGKKKRLDPNAHEYTTSEELMHLEHEAERVGQIIEERSRDNDGDTADEPKQLEHGLENVENLRVDDNNVAETAFEPEHLEHESEDVEKVNLEDREDEFRHFYDGSRLYIRQHQTEQEKIVNEMLLLTEQIKESSLLLGNCLHDTKELLSSSEMTIRHCLSATTSAQLKTGELLTRTQERECGCATWLSLLFMYFTFVFMVIYIRVN